MTIMKVTNNFSDFVYRRYKIHISKHLIQILIDPDDTDFVLSMCRIYQFKIQNSNIRFITQKLRNFYGVL